MRDEPVSSGIEVDPDTGRVVAFGRTRKRQANVNQFEIDRSIVPPGWDYQWVTFTVYGQEQVHGIVSFKENGWTEVPADRHPGMFMPHGHKGAIIRDGQVLMERPMALTVEARNEERRSAWGQSNSARQQFGIRGAPEKGFVTDTPDVRRMSYARATVEPVDGIAAPPLQRIPEKGD